LVSRPDSLASVASRAVSPIDQPLIAIDEGVPAPVITAALVERIESRGLGEYTGKAPSAIRFGLGGHAENR
jgi:6-phosphogluconate dehydrogenase (decarboxylating)